jgi:hypothetical protein
MRGELEASLAKISALENEHDKALAALEVLSSVVNSRLETISAGLLGLSARQDEAFFDLKRALSGSTAHHHATSLYLDLLESSLTGVLYEDGSIAPWTQGSYDSAVRAVGRDWPRTAKTMGLRGCAICVCSPYA